MTHCVEKKISNTFYLRIPEERKGDTAINDGRAWYLGSEQCVCWESSRKQPIQKDQLKGFNEGTSCRGVDRLAKLRRGSGHPGTNGSRKLTLVLGLTRTKGKSGVIEPSSWRKSHPLRAWAGCSWSQNQRHCGEQGWQADKYPASLSSHPPVSCWCLQPRTTGSQGWGSLGKTTQRAASWGTGPGMGELERARGQKSAQVISTACTTTWLPTMDDVYWVC